MHHNEYRGEGFEMGHPDFFCKIKTGVELCNLIYRAATILFTSPLQDIKSSLMEPKRISAFALKGI